MAWVKKTVNGLLVAQDVVTGAASGYCYTSVIDFLKPTNEAARYVSVLCTASAITGTDLDVELFAAHASGGTKYSLLDALVADMLQGTAVSKGGVVNINAYPAPYYYIGFLVQASEAANTITVTLTQAG